MCWSFYTENTFLKLSLLLNYEALNGQLCSAELCQSCITAAKRRLTVKHFISAVSNFRRANKNGIFAYINFGGHDNPDSRK